MADSEAALIEDLGDALADVSPASANGWFKPNALEGEDEEEVPLLDVDAGSVWLIVWLVATTAVAACGKSADRAELAAFLPGAIDIFRRETNAFYVITDFFK